MCEGVRESGFFIRVLFMVQGGSDGGGSDFKLRKF